MKKVIVLHDTPKSFEKEMKKMNINHLKNSNEVIFGSEGSIELHVVEGETTMKRCVELINQAQKSFKIVTHEGGIN